MRRWEAHPNIPTVKLVHIWHTTKGVSVHPTATLKKAITKFLQTHPVYRTSYEAEAIGRVWIMAYVFYLLGYIERPINPILIYLSYPDWKVQEKLRSTKKRRQPLYDTMRQLNIPSLLIKESTHWIDTHKEVIPYIKPWYDPTLLDYLKGEQ